MHPPRLRNDGDLKSKPNAVTPAKAGVQCFFDALNFLDSGFHRNDNLCYLGFYVLKPRLQRSRTKGMGTDAVRHACRRGGPPVVAQVGAKNF